MRKEVCTCDLCGELRGDHRAFTDFKIEAVGNGINLDICWQCTEKLFNKAETKSLSRMLVEALKSYV